MSRILKSIIWVFIYVTIYFFISIVVSVIASIYIFLYNTVKYGVSTNQVDILETSVYSYAGLIQFVANILIMGIISVIIYARKKRIGDSLWIHKPQKNINASNNAHYYTYKKVYSNVYKHPHNWFKNSWHNSPHIVFPKIFINKSYSLTKCY